MNPKPGEAATTRDARGQHVTVCAPVAVAFRAAPGPFNGAEAIQLHNCPLCHRTMKWIEFQAHATGCIIRNAGRAFE